METTYTYEGSRTQRRGYAPRRKARPGGRRAALGPKEGRRLAQLCVCVVLFALVFIGRGVFPGGMESLRSELLHTIQSDTDFRGAFAQLGRSISEGEPVTATLGTLWGDVFSGQEKTTPVMAAAPERVPTYLEERTFLSSSPGPVEVLSRRFGVEPIKEGPPPTATPAAPTGPTPEGTLPAQPQPVYTGAPLPQGATMEKLPLKLKETVAPVMAPLASSYGWREHPIEGGEKFHAGVDLAANYGDPIGSFADGVVDYIGESPAYGQYIQVKHDSGVTTFYAHCSKLSAQPGQMVKQGEKIAEVGDTGNVTGTHLHFEVRLNGELLDPLHYIDHLS